MLASKPDDMNLIPGTYLMERERINFKLSSDLHSSTMTSVQLPNRKEGRREGREKQPPIPFLL